MKNSLKQLLPFAVVGILSGATTFGAIEYFKTNENNSDFSYFHTANDNVKFAGINSENVGDDFVNNQIYFNLSLDSIRKLYDIQLQF